MTLLPGPEPRERHFTIVSVDDHLVEPPDLFSRFIPAALRPHGPRVIEEDGCQFWECEGVHYPQVGLNALVGRPKDEWSLEPARFYGLSDRGRIAEGWAADLIVFDPATVAPHVERTTDDLPGGSSRLFAGSDGMHHVFVNGESIVCDGQLTDATPGSLLRAGRDTDTVPIPRDHKG